MSALDSVNVISPEAFAQLVGVKKSKDGRMVPTEGTIGKLCAAVNASPDNIDSIKETLAAITDEVTPEERYKIFSEMMNTFCPRPPLGNPAKEGFNGKSNDKPAGKSNDKPKKPKFEGKPAGKSNDKPADKPAGKPKGAAKFNDRPAKSCDRPVGKSADKPAVKSYDRPKPLGKPVDKTPKEQLLQEDWAGWDAIVEKPTESVDVVKQRIGDQQALAITITRDNQTHKLAVGMRSFVTFCNSISSNPDKSPEPYESATTQNTVFKGVATKVTRRLTIEYCESKKEVKFTWFVSYKPEPEIHVYDLDTWTRICAQIKAKSN